MAWVEQHCRILLAMIRKLNGQSSFEVPPQRWAVKGMLRGLPP
jgi:hypothetical protein